MIPYLHIPLADQLGMSERLHCARRSALKEGLAHKFQRLVLGSNEAEFVAVLNRWSESLRALGSAGVGITSSGSQIDRLAVHLLVDILMPDLHVRWHPKEHVDQALNSESARVFAAVMHSLAHEVAECAFQSNPGALAHVVDEIWEQGATDINDSDLSAWSADTSETMEIVPSDIKIDTGEVNALFGVTPEEILRAAPCKSLIRVRLGRHLRHIARFRSWSMQVKSAEANKQELQIPNEHYELLAEALLKTLPDAIGAEKIAWKAKSIAGKTQHLLQVAPNLKARLSQFLEHAPLFFTPQPLVKPPRYSVEPDLAQRADSLRVPLIRYRRMNEPLRQFMGLLDADGFETHIRGLDIQQAVAWRLNLRILRCARELALIGNDSLKRPDWAARLDQRDYARLQIWCTQTLYRRRSSKRQRGVESGGPFLDSPLVASVLDDAVVDGSPVAFFIPWKADYRGRIYPETPWISPQGGDLQRALLEFADGSVVNESGWEALKRHGAILAGRSLWRVDGRQPATLSLREREQWAENHEERILACAQDPLRESFWRDASEPFQFLAFCFAYADAKSGKPCHAPVQIDGSCNGLQHIAALTGDSRLAMEVNVQMASEECAAAAAELQPRDIYALVAEESRRILSERLQDRAAINESRLEALQRFEGIFEALSDDQLKTLWDAKYKKEYLVPPLASQGGIRSRRPRADEKAWLDTAIGIVKAGKNGAKQRGLKNFDADVMRVSMRHAYQKEKHRNEIARLEDQLLCSTNDDGDKRLDALLDRKAAKSVVMTIPYGAARDGQKSSLMATLEGKSLKRRGDEIALLQRIHELSVQQLPAEQLVRFDPERLANRLFADNLVAAISDATAQLFPKIREFAKLLKDVAACVEPAPMFWKSPVGFPVFQDGFKIDKKATKAIKIAPEATARISWAKLSDKVDPGEQRRKLLPNLIHSLDSSHLILTLAKLAEEGVTQMGSIHDCLLIHPNDERTASQVVRETFAEMYAHEPGLVPRVFSEWLDWMKLLHEAANFPDRERVLLVPLKTRLTELEAAYAKNATHRSLEAVDLQVRRVSHTTDELLHGEAQARRLGQEALADFMRTAAQVQVPPKEVEKLRWVVFILQHTRDPENEEGAKKKPKAPPRWPDVSVASDPRFDIQSVKLSPYFFS